MVELPGGAGGEGGDRMGWGWEPAASAKGAFESVFGAW